MTAGPPPRPTEALQQAARALRAGRLAEAERLAATVSRSAPADRAAAGLLGTALILQGRGAEAVGPLQRAARRAEDAELETLLARALMAAGRQAEALDQLRRAVSRRPPFAQAFLDLGDTLGEAGRFDEGLAVLEAGLALIPDAVVLRVGAGYIHLRRGDRPKARARFAEAHAAAPERLDAMLALARVLAQDGEWPAAEGLYRRALRSRPGDPLIQIELGRCRLDLGDREAGEATLRAAARDDPAAAASAIRALAGARHGRFFLRPSAARRFLGLAAA